MFQLKYYKKTGTRIIFHNLTLITYALCIMSWVVGILIMLAQYYLQPDMALWHTFGYYHILAMLNCLCSLWFINCTAKGRVAGWLAESLHTALQTKDSAKKLADYREMWVDLSHMMQQLGKMIICQFGTSSYFYIIYREWNLRIKTNINKFVHIFKKKIGLLRIFMYLTLKKSS